MFIDIKNVVELNIKAIITAYLLTHIALSIYPASARVILDWRLEPDSASKRLPQTDQNKPMQFSTFGVCPGSGCPMLILAEGIIQPETVDKFKDFLKKNEYYGDTVCFNSIGGNLEGGIALGREIRKRGFDTCILNYYTSENYDGEVTIYAENSVCLSACVYAFLGGVNREIEPNAKFGVHQISGQQGNVGDSATQLALAEISAYLDEMGIDRRLLDIASKIPANEEIPSVSLNTSKRLKVENIGRSEENDKWSIEVSESGIPYIYIQSEHPYNKKIKVILIIWYDNGELLLKIKSDYNPRYYEDIVKHLKDAFSRIKLDDATPSIEIKIDNQLAAEYENVSYEILDKSMSTVLKVNNSLFRYMLNGNNIEIDINVANAWRDYNPSMNFTLKGFRKAIKVILK